MSATAVIELPRHRWQPRAGWDRLAATLRDDRGIGLIELLIALLVLNIGIFATLAAFTSGALALNRASHVSTASAISDKEMECMRDSGYADITWPMPASSSCPGTTVTGADGRTYNLSATITEGSQGTGGSTLVKQVTLTVSDPADGGKTLVQTSSTFSQCAQDLTQADCGGS